MRWLPLLGSMCLLGACFDNTIILESNDDTTRGEPGDGSTMEGPLSTTTTTTTGPSTTGPPSTVTTDTPPIPDFPSMKLDFGSDTEGFECEPPCNPDEVCIGGICFGEPCGLEPSWNECLEPDGTPNDSMCAPTEVCLSDGEPATVGICAAGCRDECDCPLAPNGVDPPVVQCEDLTGSGSPVCFLDCSAGQICPDGMMCFESFICIFPPPPP